MRKKPNRSFKEKKRGDTVLFGVSPVENCLRTASRPPIKLLIKEGGRSSRQKAILKLAEQKKVTIAEVSPHDLATTAGSKHHQGIALICGELRTMDLGEFMESTSDRPPKLMIALDQIEDPQNFGAIVRSAAFLGAGACITLKRHAAPLSAAVSKASAGALESFPMIQVGNLSESLIQLGKSGYTIIGTDSQDDCVPFASVPKSDYTVLVLGNEGQGLRQLTRKRCDVLVNIPGSGMMESLNVSAAAAILIHHFVN